MSGGQAGRRAGAAIGGYFLVKIASGLLLLKLSAAMLPVAEFTVFSQLLLLGALVTMLAVGGAQNGIIREVAASGGGALHRAVTAAGLLWVAASLLLVAPSLLAAGALSEALTGLPDYALVAPLIVIAASLSGPGQIACAALSGLRRAPASLASQAIGLVAGTGAAAALIAAGRPAGAALAFYAGSLLTLPIAWLLLHRAVPIRLVGVREGLREARVLLRYSLAFVIVASFTALTLFALRYVYLSSFGAELLGFWLVAQRISDTSTQLLGLFMTQYVVPAYAPAPPAERRPILVRSWLIGTGAMLAPFLVFAAFPELWVGLLLSDIYLPAIGLILAYMAGDVLRATASLAMHAALARARIGVYVGIEVAATTLMALVTIMLIGRGETAAPVIGYVTAFGVAALAIAAVALIRRRRAAPEPA